MKKLAFYIAIMAVVSLLFINTNSRKTIESYNDSASNYSYNMIEYSNHEKSRVIKKKKVDGKKSTESKISNTQSKVADKTEKIEKTEKTELYKPILATVNPKYSDNLGVLTGYNINNFKVRYIAGKDIAPGLYWTGTFGDSCNLARLEKKSGKWDYGTYGGEQVIFQIDLGDTLHTSCNWFQRELPKFNNSAPTGIILASQLGIGTYEIINRGSCFFTIEKLGTFSYNNRTFLPDMPIDYKINISQEDINNNMTINTDIACKGIKRVS